MRCGFVPQNYKLYFGDFYILTFFYFNPVKLSVTYKAFSAILAFNMLLSVLIPVLCNTEAMEMCEMMTGQHQSHSEHSVMEMESDMDMNMNAPAHSGMHHINAAEQMNNTPGCEMSIGCECTRSDELSENSAIITATTKVPQLFSSVVPAELPEAPEPIPPPQIKYSGSYHPPQLFLTNESFLI